MDELRQFIGNSAICVHCSSVGRETPFSLVYTNQAFRLFCLEISDLCTLFKYPVSVPSRTYAPAHHAGILAWTLDEHNGHFLYVAVRRAHVTLILSSKLAAPRPWQQHPNKPLAHPGERG